MTEKTLDIPNNPGAQEIQAPFSVASVRASLAAVALIQAVVATAGSLYFSEVMHYPPCSLCWYQRIFMYPLIIILGVGLWLRDSRMNLYALPMSLIGLAIAFYHNLITYDLISAGSGVCSAGISCTTRWINWFGFVTIPLLSMIAFAVITLCLLYYLPRQEYVEVWELEEEGGEAVG
jgi:disulfide bond formation protein DsbB